MSTMRRPREKDDLVEMLQRTTMCVSGPEPGVPAHEGDAVFRETLRQHYSIAENNAVEQLVRLKGKLREADTHDFWSLLMEGMTSITGAQYGFVAKRILSDDHDSTVEMPVFGEPGSCLMGVAFYYNDGRELKALHRDYKYMAYGAPCHYMKHDKVFLIPNGLPNFITDNPNKLPFPADAYLGVPLFADGKCFGHFGMMWDSQGREELRLGWAYIEMLMHSLEELIHRRLVDGRGYVTESARDHVPKVIPAGAVTAAQSLKPYASSLSHELRTPMQGVVGMLDVMHATIQESLEGQEDAVVRNVFESLRENIEVVQDSSRRAVEAADNVVHAYDLNMEVPDTPANSMDDDCMEGDANPSAETRKPQRITDEKNAFFRRSKRHRTSDSAESITPPALKLRHLQTSRPSSLRHAVEEGRDIARMAEFSGRPTARHSPTADIHATQIAPDTASLTSPALRYTRLRELLRLIINESLRVGGRPDSAIARETFGGEVIEVKTRGTDGRLHVKMIDWSVDAQVPESILVDERDLAKLVSCVFLNAVKFTEQGKITLKVAMSSKGRFILISISDTGPGIPEAFRPYLFRPFSREDDTITREKEGLGLGLLVAKGLARKIGGDLLCVKTQVEGPGRGSEFELRIPLSATDAASKRATPTHTPSPAPRSSDRSLVQGRTPNPALASRSERAARASVEASKFHDEESNILATPRTSSLRSPRRQTIEFDRHLAQKHPLTFLVAEDNQINRKLLVNMLKKLGYTNIYEAHDGVEAVHQMSIDRAARNEAAIDVVLMDIWMPHMDGYEATQRIFAIDKHRQERMGTRGDSMDGNDLVRRGVTVVAVSADVTDAALEKASAVGMEGFMPKPHRIQDLERLILEHCVGGGALMQV